MPPDTDAARWKRILREQADAADLESRVAALERARAEAVLVLEQARTAVDDLDGELRGMRQRQQQAADCVAEMRMRYRRDLVRRMPAELLSSIFEEVTALPADFRLTTEAQDYYDEKLAMAPFCLAAVCTEWRNVALHQSSLWTYISAPLHKDDDEPGKHRNRVELLLARSQSASLDILFSWEEWLPCGPEHQILLDVAAHAERWRTFELWLPDNSTNGHELGVFRTPLPRLERLYLVVDFRAGDIVTTSDFLRFAPALRELFLWGPNIISPNARASFPALTSLQLWHQPHFDVVWQILPTVAPTLESLLLAFDSTERGVHIPQYVVTLPKLRSASLLITSRTIWRQLHRLRTPSLRNLTINMAGMAADVVQPFIDKIAGTVVSLTLSGHVSLSHLVPLKALIHVESLRFDLVATEYNDRYEISSDFFGAEAVWVQERIWPKLSAVILSANGSLDNEEYESLLPFVHWRTIDVDRWEGDETAPRRLETLVLEPVGVPQWLKSQAQRLVGTHYKIPTRE